MHSALSDTALAGDAGTKMADPIESVLPSDDGDADVGTGKKDPIELVSPSEDEALDLSQAPVAGNMFSSDSQLDEEVDSFLRGEAEESYPVGAVGKSSDVKETAVVEAKWSDFQFSQVGSFSDFLSDLGGGQIDPQPVTNPAVQGLDSGWPGIGGSAADANGSLTLQEHFAAKLDMAFSDTSAYWERTSNYTEVHEVEHVIQNGAAEGAETWQDKAGGVYTELPLTGMVDGYKNASGVLDAGSSLAAGSQQLQTIETPFHEQSSVFEYVDPNLYYEDPQHPGWIYCYRTGQWLAKPVYQKDKYDHGAEHGTEFSATQQPETSSSFQEKLAGSTEVVKDASPDQWGRLNTESSAMFPVASVSKDPLIVENTSSPRSQGMSSVYYPGGEEIPAVFGSSEVTANGGGNIQGGRGYDPNYPGWYYDYQSEQWCTETQHPDAEHITYPADTQGGQPYDGIVDHQGQQQSYAAASQGQHNWAAKQDHYGQGAPEAKQGNMYAGEQVQGLAYQTPTKDQQAQFQSHVPLSQGQYQYQSGGFHDSLRADMNGHDLARYNAEPWSSSQSLPNSTQPGAILSADSAPYLSNDSAFGKQYAKEGWNNGYLGQQPTSSHAQLYPQQYQYDQQYAYQQQHHQQLQQQMNSGFSNYEQSWGFSHQYQHAQSWTPLISVPKTTAEAVRTSAGRPPHALCAFGFGGKIAIMKHRDPLRLQTSDGEQSIASGQAWTPSAVRLLNLFQLVSPTVESGHKAAGSLYFESLTRRTYNGPLVGGGLSSKELIRWIEEREKVCKEEVKNCTLDDLHRKNLESLSDLWGVLKIMCQHHGKLRSTVGTTGITVQEADGPETALANLLASGTSQNGWAMGFSTLISSLQTTPSEQQLQKTAAEMTKLLIAGKRKDALQHATEGQLWGPALLLAWQLGEKFYGETVIEMSRSLLVAGSPLRTLSLLLAGQPASEVFAGKGITTTVTASPHSAAQSGARDTTQDAIHRMMEEWRSNLAIMSANRTNGDDRVMMYLGDCLSEMRQEVEAAHICYLIADSNFESFSRTARLCLLGANHRLYPRTYVTPEAIQRTELYEHAKVLGNPQFFLPQFQPYKLVYAYMLVEAGKTTEALRYCQAILKMLKMAGRSPEVETCRQAAASLEERIKIHTNSGSNTVPKLFQGITSILKTMDKGISGIIGGAPPPMSSEPYPNAGVENGGKIPVPSDASWPPASHFVPSTSMDPLNGLIHGNDRKNRPSRSVSEPDFSKSPKSQEASELQSAASKSPAKGGSSNSVFARFGSNILQKAVFLVGKSTKEAKLGEKNKFYYDEKLKRWVEEGAELPPEEAVLAPPPTAAKFVTPVEETSVNPPAGLTVSAGTPPVPPSGNQFSARSRQGVRSRYVDTLSKGGASTPQKSSVSSLVPTARLSPPQAMNFFVPAPIASSSSDFVAAELDSGQGNSDVSGNSGQANESGSYYSGGLDSGAFKEQERPGQRNSHSVSREAPSMHRVGSVDNAVGFAAFSKPDGEGRVLGHPRTRSGSVPVANGSHTRAASWGGYPSSYGSVAEGSASSHSNSPGLLASADYLMPGTMLSANNSSSHGGSYFSPPTSQMEVNPSQLVNLSLPLPPPIDSHRGTPVVNGLPLVHMGTIQNGDMAGVTLNAEEMQEVEL